MIEINLGSSRVSFQLLMIVNSKGINKTLWFTLWFAVAADSWELNTLEELGTGTSRTNEETLELHKARTDSNRVHGASSFGERERI